MVKIELTCGFVAEVDENVFLNDYELFEDVSLFMQPGQETEKFAAIGRIQSAILGEEQKTAFRNALRDEHGKIPVSVMANATAELIRGGAPKKS